MRKLREFLRLRKRYDSIKFALILFICATYFLVNGVVQIVSYCGYLNKPTEYILEAYSDCASLEIALQKICDTESAVCASFQRDYVVTSENDAVLIVSELSAEYLLECYRIESDENGKKIWLNTTAFDEFVGETDETSVRLSYTVDGKNESAEFIRCDALDSETAYAVSVGTTASLDDSTVVRVMFDSIDVSGSNMKHLENLGYSISNGEKVILEVHEQELLFLNVKYSIIATVLSLVGAYLFIEIYKLKRTDNL